MIDIIKKAILTGIGVSVVTKEAVEKRLEDFVAIGKISSNEAKEMAGKIIEEGKKEFEETKESIGNVLNDSLNKANIVTQSQIEKLEERISKIEEKLDLK